MYTNVEQNCWSNIQHLKNMIDPYRKLVNLKLFKSKKIYKKKLKKYMNLYQNAVKKTIKF